MSVCVAHQRNCMLKYWCIHSNRIIDVYVLRVLLLLHHRIDAIGICIDYVFPLVNFTDKALKCISQYISTHPNILSRNLPFDETTLINKLNNQLNSTRSPATVAQFTGCYEQLSSCVSIGVGARFASAQQLLPASFPSLVVLLLACDV